MRTTTAITVTLLFGLVFQSCASAEDTQPRIFINAFGFYWPTSTLIGLADVYGVPVAVESSDYDGWRRFDSEGVLVSLPFVANDLDAGMQLLLKEIQAVTGTDDAYTVTALTDKQPRWGPPHRIFSRNVPPALFEFIGELRQMGVIARFMQDNGPDRVVCYDQIDVRIPKFERSTNPTYLDLLPIWSKDLAGQYQRNISWYLMPLAPGRRIASERQTIRFGLTGIQGGIGALRGDNVQASRWVCRVGSFHPMLGAMELTQAMDESRVDFYVYTVPGAIDMTEDHTRLRPAGVHYGPDGQVMEILQWSIFAAGLAGNDPLGEIIRSLRNGIAVQRVRHESGSTVQINHGPEFFSVPSRVDDESVFASVEEFLIATLHRHWPDMVLQVGSTGPITDEQHAVLDLSRVQTVRDMLVALVPADVKGTWALIEDLEGVHTLSFMPMGQVKELSP